MEMIERNRRKRRTCFQVAIGTKEQNFTLYRSL